MFLSQKVEHFIQSVKFSGDAEKPALNIACYKTPLDHDLCYEIDHQIAKQLFRKEGSIYNPVVEFDDVTLKVPNISGAFNIEWFPHDADGADGAGRLTTSCVIGKVEAQKLFADKNDWSLVWHVTIPLDSNSLELAHKYYKKSVFLTLERAQAEIPFQADDKKVIILDDASVECGSPIACAICNDLAMFLATDQSAYCERHVKAAIGLQVRKIKYVDAVQA